MIGDSGYARSIRPAAGLSGLDDHQVKDEGELGMKRFLIILFVGLLAFSQATHGQEVRSVDALFVYQERSRDAIDAIAWQEVLRTYQIECRLVSRKQLSQEHLFDVDVVIVGPHTAERPEDKSIRWFKYWGEPWLVDAMAESELPVIGLSMAGLSLFGQMGLPVGGGYYGHVNERFFKFAEDAQEYLEAPFRIEAIGEVELSTREQQVDGYYNPPFYTESILRNATASFYYPVVRYKNYVVWGVGSDAGYLTDLGRRLFANILHKLAGS